MLRSGLQQFLDAWVPVCDGYQKMHVVDWMKLLVENCQWLFCKGHLVLQYLLMNWLL